MSIPTLRKYQIEIREEARRLMKKNIRSILIQAPTGAGKTVLVAHMLKTAESKGMSAWFIVHRRELIKQSVLEFNNVKVKHGVIASGWDSDKKQRIQIASIQTLSRRYKQYGTPNLIIYDECQHSGAKTWSRLYAEFPKSFHVGLTATPVRLDGTGLKKWFSHMVKGPSVRELIDQKYLSDYKAYAPSNLNLSGIHTRMGDFIMSEVAAVIDRPSITGNVINHYLKLCNNKRAVVFCASVEHSKHIVEQFNKCGIKAKHVDGDTNRKERDAAVSDFRKGKIFVLSNVDLFGEGFDLPTLEAVILLRPTMSLGLYLQQCGRSLRPSEGKDYAIILDHVGNCARHGLPDDEREWTLEGSRNKRDNAGQEVRIKTCPKCYAVQRIGLLACLSCGYIFEGEPRKIDEVDGELTEINSVILRKMRKQEQGTSRTEEELVKLGIKRGYKRPRLWARHVVRGRGI